MSVGSRRLPSFHRETAIAKMLSIAGGWSLVSSPVCV